MDALGLDRVRLIGHDTGGRLGLAPAAVRTARDGISGPGAGGWRVRDGAGSAALRRGRVT
jgi:pimeloyl-ACP methyl ester carboxylesterase